MTCGQDAEDAIGHAQYPFPVWPLCPTPLMATLQSAKFLPLSPTAATLLTQYHS